MPSSTSRATHPRARHDESVWNLIEAPHASNGRVSRTPWPRPRPWKFTSTCAQRPSDNVTMPEVSTRPRKCRRGHNLSHIPLPHGHRLSLICACGISNWPAPNYGATVKAPSRKTMSFRLRPPCRRFLPNRFGSATAVSKLHRPWCASCRRLARQAHEAPGLQRSPCPRCEGAHRPQRARARILNIAAPALPKCE